MITPEVFDSVDELTETSFLDVISAAKRAITDHGFFAIALAGGSTPETLYQRIAVEVSLGNLNVSQWKVFLGDERLVPSDHEFSNFGMANRTLLSPAKFREDQVHWVRTELGDPLKIALAYEHDIRNSGLREIGGIPQFDLILAGMGSDGHTLSLFPGKEALKETKKLVVATTHGSLPPPVDRVTFTLPLVNTADRVLFMVTKGDKHPALQEIMAGKLLPAALIQPHGTLRWLVDRAAYDG